MTKFGCSQDAEKETEERLLDVCLKMPKEGRAQIILPLENE